MVNTSRRDYYYRGKNHWQNDIWDEKGDNHYFIDRTLMFQYSFQQLCKSLGLKYKQVQIINTYESAKWVGSDDVWYLQKVKFYQENNIIFKCKKILYLI